MPSVSIGATIGGSLLSGASSLIGGSKQQKAGQSAASNQMAMFNQTQQNLKPYMAAGTAGIGDVEQLLGLAPTAGSGGVDEQKTLAQIKTGLQQWSAAKPGNAEPIIKMIDSGADLGSVSSALTTLRQTTTNPANTQFLDPLINQAANPVMSQAQGGGSMMDRLAQTPGYQFALQQGLQASQAGFAAQGLGQSGAAMKGAANYAAGLASQTYQQQVGNAFQLMGMGQNAAAGLGALGQQAASTAGGFSTSGAAAGAGGLVGAANVVGQGATNAAMLGQLGQFGNSAQGSGQFNTATAPMAYGTPQINSNTFAPTYTPTGYAYGP